MANSETSDAPAQRPVHVIDHFPVRASIWRNTAETGVVWYSATVTKRYKLTASAPAGQPNYGATHRLSADDLLPAAQALEAAYAWIQKRRHDEYVEATNFSSEQ